MPRKTEPSPDREGRWMRQKGMRIVACDVEDFDGVLNFRDDYGAEWRPVSEVSRGWRGMTDLDPEAFRAYEEAGNVRVS